MNVVCVSVKETNNSHGQHIITDKGSESKYLDPEGPGLLHRQNDVSIAQHPILFPRRNIVG